MDSKHQLVVIWKNGLHKVKKRRRKKLNLELNCLGVLLLNTSLSVRAHEAASHANKGWEVC